MKPQFSYSAKVVIIGDSGVGKTNLLLRLCEDAFKNSYVATIGVDFKNKFVDIGGGATMKLQIWDTAGQERYRTIQSAYYKGAMGIVLVYSADDKKSFSNIGKHQGYTEGWMRQISDYASPEIAKILVCNKCDLIDSERRVSAKQGQQLAERFSVRYIEASAKDGTNVSRIFEQLAQDISHQVSPDSVALMKKNSELSRKSLDRKQERSCDC